MIRTDIKFTADDYRTLPETGPRYQLIEGDLVRMTPAPSRRHQDLALELGVRLRTFVRARRPSGARPPKGRGETPRRLRNAPPRRGSGAAERADSPGYVAVAPHDVYLSDHDVLQPDVLALTTDRQDRLAQDGIHGAPDLIAEVLSPSTRHLDLGLKRRLYARHGVREYWVVDPQDETVTRYDLETLADARPLGAGATIASTVFPGFTLDVGEYFAAA